MSLVERLAEKWSEHLDTLTTTIAATPEGHTILSDDMSRWWLRAIADELEAEMHGAWELTDGRYHDRWDGAIRWLRKAAAEPLPH